jgi:excisionase family DNA binding protein
MNSTLSVRDLCKRYGVSEHTVLGWIRSGELRAVNVGRRLDGKKPRWRISPEALTAFELARAATPARPQTRQRKRSAAVIEFYK